MNKTIWIVVLVVAVVGAVGYYYYSGNRYQAPPPMPMQNNGSSTGQAPAGTNISIQNFAFNPATLTVKVGDTVTWTNNDTVQHQIKSNTFNSAALSQGQTFSFTFTAAGTFDYSCAIHPTMHGQIIVQ